MIRIEIDDANLRVGIDAKSETWLDDAKATMAANTPDALGEKPKWSKVKPVYIHAQHGKCGYCERKLAKDPSYRPMWRSYDVEHYRPKGATKIWPPAKLAEQRQLAYPQWLPLGAAGTSGYYRLTHHHWNYLASCAACNQAHKRDYFPIAGTRRLGGRDPAQLNEQEWPYLIFPLGDLDDDPADLIRFEGLLPMPVETDEGLHDHWRARITIDFFDLHSEELVIDRADQIVTLFIALETASNPDQSPQTRNLAAETIARRTAASAAHSACARAFHRLWLDLETRGRAEAIAEQAGKLLAMQA